MSTAAPLENDRSAPLRIAVVRVRRGLGDLLCAVPALRALRAGTNSAHVTLVGAPGATWFANRFSRYIDDMMVLPAWPGLPETSDDVNSATRFLIEAQSRRFDLALQMHGSGGVSNPLTAMLGARTMAGHAVPGQWWPGTGWFGPYPADSHEVHRQLGVTRLVGIPDCGDSLEFPLATADLGERMTLIADGAVPAGDYACVHAGASVSARRWSPEAFATVADQLAERGLGIVLTGSASEKPITAAVARAMHADVVDLAGRTSLGGLAAVVEAASVVITNDTGVSHLAAALATPSVVIFLASDSARWAPLHHQRHRSIEVAPADAVGDGVGRVMAAACELVADDVRLASIP